MLSASTYTSVKPLNPATPAPRDALTFDIAGEGHLLQDIVDKQLHGQEFIEACLSIWLAITAALLRTTPQNQKAKQSQRWQQRKDDQDCGGAAKTIKNHSGNDDKDNQDDHGGSDNNMKTITVAIVM
ncbi:hypothetical protein EDB85DRAFT_2138588 [Lactarius pseudohatsudake]|nr:hypothetical protein EDB85DRAFT_2138588 [Lactarius pseudohatsudake]